ncbi:translation initiation factor IF-2 [Diatrype stigma]|uniref:Translation initiation factor IF-2 n=1 Tax=Diatrype stigma TaxID=117547 RepID=A0AAN9YU59_9PEZI
MAAETTATDPGSNGADEKNSWGLLTRKAVPAPEKSTSEDFWNVVSKNLIDGDKTETNSGSKEPVDSGLLTRKAAPAPEKSTSDVSWNKVSENIIDGDKAETNSGSKVPVDWGLEYDQQIQYRAVPVTPSSDTPTSPDGVVDGIYISSNITRPASSSDPKDGEPKIEALEDRRSRGRDKGPDKREKDRGKSKKAGRDSRYDGESYGEEDDAYYDYEERRRIKAERKAQKEAARRGPIPIHLPELISIAALADALKIKRNVFLQQLGELGFEGVTLDSLMAGDTAALVAQEYGFEPIVDVGASRDLKPRPPPADPSSLPPRPPVVTIMGHVDHGKTTLLDYLRKSSVAAQEHGGITQHIGAFSVSLSSGKVITFLDTPGHAAFLTMRERGAQVTDIVVLVVAADDSVMPQTLEAIKHAKAHKVPIIVAINKIDIEGASIDQVKSDLASTGGLEIEDYGGDVQVVLVSGLTGQGMDDLEENILTLSEILDHRAERDGPAEGWVLESSLKQSGKTATILVKRGTLRTGDYIAAGFTWAKIRHMRNEAGADVLEAPPGTPVEVFGFKDLPAAGDQVLQGDDEDHVKSAAEYRENLHEREKAAADHEAIAEARRQHQERRAREKAAVEGSGLRAPVGGNWNSRKAAQYMQAKQEAAEAMAAAAAAEDTAAAAGGGPSKEGGKVINFIVKADVHGSVEAVSAAIQEIGSHEVRPRVLRAAPGPISEFDVELAAASGATLVSFANTIPAHVRRMAEEHRVRILDHTVIYHLIDDAKALLSEHLPPEVSVRVLGDAEVLEIFPINIKGRKYKNVAGCRVRTGVVARGSLYRVVRDGEKIFEGGFFFSSFHFLFCVVRMHSSHWGSLHCPCKDSERGV